MSGPKRTAGPVARRGKGRRRDRGQRPGYRPFRALKHPKSERAATNSSALLADADRRAQAALDRALGESR